MNNNKNNVLRNKLKNWTMVSCLVVNIAGQPILFNSQAQAVSFVGVKDVKFLSLQEVKNITFPKDSVYKALDVDLTDEILKKVSKKSEVTVMSKDKETKIWQVFDKSQKSLGYFFVDKVYGKHELITYSVGINNDGTVRHIEILEYKETYGWQIDNEKWREQFVGKNINSSLELNKDIKNISGATLSCKHITEGVKRMLALYEIAIKNKA